MGKSYKEAFQMAVNKIHEYPTCDNLIYSVTLYLEGADMTALSNRVVVSFCEELSSKEEFAFMRDCTEFKELITQMSCEVYL